MPASFNNLASYLKICVNFSSCHWFIDLGELISRQARAETVKAHKLMIEKAVADTWEEADKEKVKAVEETLEKTQIKHEKQLRRLSKQHERALTVSMLWNYVIVVCGVVPCREVKTWLDHGATLSHLLISCYTFRNVGYDGMTTLIVQFKHITLFWW